MTKKVRVKNKTNSVLTLKANSGTNQPTINVLPRTIVSFNDVDEYAMYSSCIKSFMSADFIGIATDDEKFEEKKVETPVEPVKEEVVEEVKPVSKKKVSKKASKKKSSKKVSKKAVKSKIQESLNELQIEFKSASASRKVEIKQEVIKLKDQAKNL